MSKAQRNSESIVGYYHSAKRIWITNINQIKFQIINPPAKSASKNIFQILQDWINEATTPGLAGGAGEVSLSKRRKSNNEKSNKRTRENPMEAMEGHNSKKQKIENKKEVAHAITLSYFCDQEKWDWDDSKIEEYGQYVYYNTMADWLYVDNNFETYKNSLLIKVLYDVNGTEYLSSNCVFEIFSNDFVDKMINMLKIYSTQKNIQQQDINKIIGQCAIYILTKIELKPDNIVPPNKQIDISKKLDDEYFEIKEIINDMINNPKENDVARGNTVGPDSTNKELDYSRRGSPRGVDWDMSQEDMSQEDMSQEGGFSKKKTIRKRTNKKRTNKKRTNKKRTNKKKTIKKKIKRTIYKTRKMH